MKYLPFFLVFLLPYMAAAKSWTLDPSSTLTFKATQGEKTFEGRFSKFSADIDLDPENPSKGRILVTVSMASAQAGSNERTTALPQREWFDAKQFPDAVFQSKTIQKTKDGYVATGTLTIKGITKPVTLPFTLTPADKKMRAQGSLTLLRNDYGIGIGEWSSDQWVKFPVTVSFDLVAH